MRLVDGAVVVLEGLDAAGKSTQAEALMDLGWDGGGPALVHMPSGLTALTRAVYEAMEEGELRSMFARQLFHLACHAENVPLLAETRDGGLVLDRWWWSTWAYGVRSSELTHRQRQVLKEAIEVIWDGLDPAVVFVFLDPFRDDRHNTPAVGAAYRELVDEHPGLGVVVPPGDADERLRFMLSELQSRDLVVS